MDSGGRSSAPARMEDILGSPKDLRAAASNRFLEDGRGFKNIFLALGARFG